MRNLLILLTPKFLMLETCGGYRSGLGLFVQQKSIRYIEFDSQCSDTMKLRCRGVAPRARPGAGCRAGGEGAQVNDAPRLGPAAPAERACPQPA